MYRTPQELAQPIIEAINFIHANSEEIVPLMVAESGSTHSKAHFEIEQVALPMMREASSFPFRAFGESMTSVIPGKENLAKRQPILSSRRPRFFAIRYLSYFCSHQLRSKSTVIN
jgi:hypothetical protein